MTDSDLPTVQPTQVSRVHQLRLIVEATDFDSALSFYRDVVGLEEQSAVESAGEARVAILSAGRATLELVNPKQKAAIDDAEVGAQVSRSVRVAFEVDDVDKATDRLARAGARVLATPTSTPWRSRNARLEGPAGVQLTLFEEQV